MGYVRIGLIALVALSLGSSGLATGYTTATYTNGTNSVKVTLYATSSSSVQAATTKGTNCANPTGCGYALPTAKVGSNAALVYWQGGTLPSGGTNPLTFTLGTGAGLHAYDQYAPCTFCNPNSFTSPEPWRSPSGDRGYILSANDTATSPLATVGIKITPTTSGAYFSALSFYWGSVDPWNTVIFTDAANSADTVYVTGSNLSSQGVSVPCTVPANCTSASYNNTDVVVLFQVGLLSDGKTLGDSWSSIQLLSCEATGTSGPLTTPCSPAFEIDQLQYARTSCTSYGVPLGCTAPVTQSGETTSPTPEPTSLLLLGSGIAGIAGRLRRKAVAQNRACPPLFPRRP